MGRSTKFVSQGDHVHTNPADNLLKSDISIKWYGKTRVISYGLRVASYELLVTSSKLKSMS